MNLKVYSVEVCNYYRGERYIIAANSKEECGLMIELYHFKNKDDKYFPFTEEDIKETYMDNKESIIRHYEDFLCNTSDFFEPKVLEYSQYEDL